MSKVIKTTVYLADMADWDLVNEVYKDVFGAHKPARAIVSSPNLHFGCGVEIDAVAAV
jgi:2-iminobutanoate/2-iminopropanoate deaminase